MTHCIKYSDYLAGQQLYDLVGGPWAGSCVGCDFPKTYYFRIIPERLNIGTYWPTDMNGNTTVMGGFGNPLDVQIFYMDSSYTTPATQPPGPEDTVIIQGDGMANIYLPCTPIKKLIVKNNVVVAGGANAVLSLDTGEFYDDANIGCSFIVRTSLTFNNRSSNGASQTAPFIVLNDRAQNGGALNGNVILNGCSNNDGGVFGSLTVNNHSTCAGGILGCGSMVSGTLTINSDGICP